MEVLLEPGENRRDASHDNNRGGASDSSSCTPSGVVRSQNELNGVLPKTRTLRNPCSAKVIRRDPRTLPRQARIRIE
jgi:hypothetical protein